VGMCCKFMQFRIGFNSEDCNDCLGFMDVENLLPTVQVPCQIVNHYSINAF